MRFKSGVKVGGLQPEILTALAVADGVYREHGAEFVVTSVMDGRHGPGSKHYEGFGFDSRTRHVARPVAERIADEVRRRLTDEYDVVLESDHLHVEFDPKEALL